MFVLPTELKTLPICPLVKHVIGEQNTMAANEIIEPFYELIVTRLPIIARQKEYQDICQMRPKDVLSGAVHRGQPIRESSEDQMGILSLISSKSGASVFGSASTAEQVTDGVDTAGLTVLVTVCRCGRPATDGKMLMWRQAWLIHGGLYVLSFLNCYVLPPEAMMDLWWDGTNKKRLYQYSKYVSSIAALSFSMDGASACCGIKIWLRRGR